MLQNVTFVKMDMHLNLKNVKMRVHPLAKHAALLRPFALIVLKSIGLILIKNAIQNA